MNRRIIKRSPKDFAKERSKRKPPCYDNSLLALKNFFNDGFSPLYSGHAENSQTWKKGKSGEKNRASGRKTREERGWNVAVNSGWRDVRISSYVWRPYFFHDDSGGRLTESRNFGTAPNYYRPVCFTLCPIGLLSVTSFPLPNRIQKGYVNFRIAAISPWENLGRTPPPSNEKLEASHFRTWLPRIRRPSNFKFISIACIF